VIDLKTFDRVSQSSHWLGGAFALIGSVYLFGEDCKIFAGVIILVLAAVKEFWYDYKFETSEVRGSSLKDFLFYVLGVATGFAMILIHSPGVV